MVDMFEQNLVNQALEYIEDDDKKGALRMAKNILREDKDNAWGWAIAYVCIEEQTQKEKALEQALKTLKRIRSQENVEAEKWLNKQLPKKARKATPKKEPVKQADWAEPNGPDIYSVAKDSKPEEETKPIRQNEGQGLIIAAVVLIVLLCCVAIALYVTKPFGGSGLNAGSINIFPDEHVCRFEVDQNLPGAHTLSIMVIPATYTVRVFNQWNNEITFEFYEAGSGEADDDLAMYVTEQMATGEHPYIVDIYDGDRKIDAFDFKTSGTNMTSLLVICD